MTRTSLSGVSRALRLTLVVHAALASCTRTRLMRANRTTPDGRRLTQEERALAAAHHPAEPLRMNDSDDDGTSLGPSRGAPRRCDGCAMKKWCEFCLHLEHVDFSRLALMYPPVCWLLRVTTHQFTSSPVIQ